jgi:hypothetical protein
MHINVLFVIVLQKEKEVEKHCSSASHTKNSAAMRYKKLPPCHHREYLLGCHIY